MRTRESENNPSSDIAAAWRSQADAVAEWTARRLVNRVDAWGGYVDEADRSKIVTHANGKVGPLGKTLTRPAVRHRGRVFLTEEVLRRHFRATAARHLVGLHTTSAENTSRWGGPEIDWHGPDSTAPAVNLAAALAWYEKLAGLGFHPLLTDSNGAGGYHGPLVLLAEPVPTPRLYHFLKHLVADHARHGLPAPPELFPKQPCIKPGGFGNWLRLPGRHHTRPHWSRVWSGERWLEGAEAVRFILAVEGDPVQLVPDLPPPAVAPPTSRSAFHQRAGSSSTSACGNLSARIAAYAARLPHLREGQGRTRVAFSFAAWMARDLSIADDFALGWLEKWDAGNHPPLGQARLAEILADAHQYGRNALGCGLAPEPAARTFFPRRVRPGHTILSFTVEVR